MMAELDIENFALLEKANLTFSPGLDVLTGETGAGKSMVLDAVAFLLGDMPRQKPLRTGTESGRVSARFTEVSPEAQDLVRQWGLDSPEGDIILSRDMRASGRSVCRINSQMATVSNLRELGALLIDIHGQHQQYSLIRPSEHIHILDSYIGGEHLAKVKEYAQNHALVKKLEGRLQGLREGERVRLREIDWARHEIDEIEKVNPKPGEDEELESQIAVLSSAEELENGTRKAYETVSGDGGAFDQLAGALDLVRSLTNKDTALGELSRRLEEVLTLAEDCGHELYSYADKVVCDPRELQELEERSEEIRSLKRKYGPTLDDVLRYLEDTKQKLFDLEHQGEMGEQLDAELAEANMRREKLGHQLSENRREKAPLLAAEVADELEKVGMPLCRFLVDCHPLEQPLCDGWDSVEFLIAPNPGEEPKPLARIASGGELSRIMLALLCVFTKFSPSATMIFDEIDSGLGGRAAQAVANRLRELSRRSQVVCVTHLAILAAAGDSQHHLQKQVEGERTVTTVSALEGREREEEIVRMLAGDATLSTGLEHARELLSSFHKA